MNMGCRLRARQTAESQRDPRGLLVRTEQHRSRTSSGRVIWWHFLRTRQVTGKKSWLLSLDFINRTVAVRDNKEVSIRRRFDGSRDAKVPANEKAFTLGDVELVNVVGYQVIQPRVLKEVVLSIRGEFETEEKTTRQRGP